MEVPLVISLGGSAQDLGQEEKILECIAEAKKPTFEQIQELDQVSICSTMLGNNVCALWL